MIDIIKDYDSQPAFADFYQELRGRMVSPHGAFS